MEPTTAALITAALTVVNLVIAVFNIFYTQGRTDRRELTKWSSDNLLKLISNLIQLSSERQSIHTEMLKALEENRAWPDRPRRTDEMVWEMESIVAQIRLLNDNVALDATAIYEAHKKCEDDYAGADWDALGLGPEEMANTLMVNGLFQLHLAVINSFRKVAGLPTTARRPVLAQGSTV